MRLTSRKLRWLGVAGVGVVAGFFAVRAWVVPTIIRQQIRAHYNGKVEVDDWWLGLHSAGLKGVRLSESDAADAPTWLSADRVSTDLSLAGMLHGRFLPSRVEVDRPVVNLRFDAKGQPLTKIPLVENRQAKPAPLPEIVAKGGTITLGQDGRKPMTIHGVDGDLKPSASGSDLAIGSDDPTWGKVAARGHFNPSFKVGSFEINSSPGFVADADKLERIPFIPTDVWSNVAPSGPVDAKVLIKFDADAKKPVSVHTDLALKGDSARLNSLQVETTATTGRVVIDDALVKLEGLKGKTLGGSIAVDGGLDFGEKVPRFDLAMRLRGVDVTKAPAAWQLGEVGATGKLSGRADLKVALDPSGPDLTGSTGRAVIEDGSFQGIPIKSLSLGLKAEGGDLQYETLPEGTVDKNHLDKPTKPEVLAEGGSDPKVPAQSLSPVALPEPVLAALPILELASQGQGMLSWAAYAMKQAIAYQVREATHPQMAGLRLPKTITTRIEIEDVDLLTIVAKARKFGFEVPIPIAGRFSITAEATIPLGTLRDLKAYGFKGDATLRGASLDNVDLGLVTTHVDLTNGVLTLTDFRGRLVDRPNGGVANPPAPSGNTPSAGPLPAGGFRGQVRAALVPKGQITAKFEGQALPLGEVFAPFLPQPSPLGGEATVRFDASANLANLGDSKTWNLSGHIDSRRIKYQGAELDQVTSSFGVKQGRVDLPDFAAKLLGKPLQARLSAGLAPPYQYNGSIYVQAWEIGKIADFVPGLPKPSPFSGILDASGEAAGSLQPFDVKTQGAARVMDAKAGPAPIGNLGFHWRTDADAVVVSGLELYAFGGQATGGASIPIRPGKPLHASIDVKGIDAGKLVAATPIKALALTGKADGRLDLTMPLDASTIEGTAMLESTSMTVREGQGEGTPVKSLLVQAVAREGNLTYEATAQGLGGKLRFHGSAPVDQGLKKAVAKGEVLLVGFRLGEVWRGLGMTGGVSHLDGLGAFDANIVAPLDPFRLSGRGLFELRDLRYGKLPPLGSLRGVVSLVPGSWRVDQLEGDLMGGRASGDIRSETSPGGSKVVSFDMKLERASLAKIARTFPSVARDIEGFGSVRMAGRVADALRANAEVLVPRARVHGIPVTDLRLPVELELNPATGSGAIHSRHWSARVAGGSVRGSASNRLGIRRTFESEMQINGVDLAVLSKFHPTGKRPPTGKISGKVELSGPDAERLDKMRGRVDVTLADASLVEVPVFKALDKFLGASGGGGLFEEGEVHGTIANNTLYVERMTLTGRILQVHATGSIGLGGALNLEILVNTSTRISPGQLALLNVLPGIGRALGQGEEAIRRVAAVLENSLLKFRVTGTTASPHVQLDPGVNVGGSAVGFFTSVIKLPGR